ncbi:uncharacterized protein LOC141660029 [Apium graveolens]|uniref:uncharacterized protein LOC141660029 n=1 Tax=Apium graveolens TaxID=4045 RepID=UPI003D79CDFC
MNIVGRQFTWEKGASTDEFMEVRLDRAMNTNLWLQTFPVAKLYNLDGSEIIESDHCPIFFVPQQVHKLISPPHFRFENEWLLDLMCKVIVKDGWVDDSGLNIQQKIKNCSDRLMIWGKEITGGPYLDTCTKSIRARRPPPSAMNDPDLEMRKYKGEQDADSQAKFNEARKNMALVLNQREVFWRQRSKQLWLQSGDQNSRYFHASASTRRKNNQIHRLQNEDGQWVDWENGMTELISNYFPSLFNSVDAHWEDIIQCIPSTITSEQNEYLLREIIVKEVKDALFQMHLDKSPGPDGMTPAFFKSTSQLWELIL